MFPSSRSFHLHLTKENRIKVTKLKMKNHFIFWIAVWIFPVVVQARGQKPNPAGFSSSCGGVLELSSGVLDFSPADQNGQTPDFCMWVIKLPKNSQKIQFELTQIPPSSKLNLYSQDGHTAGQISILPIASVRIKFPTNLSLTSANINSKVNTNSSTLIAIWTASRLENENVDEGGLLSFTWDKPNEQIQSQNGEEEIQSKALNLVGGVSYVNSDRGRFSWAKPGKSQQTLLWVLNSKSSAADSIELKIETNFEKCDLVDPCLCSYFGVYEVHENFLHAVSTECGRSSNLQWNGIRPRLVALGFVNPEFRRDTNHVTLSWKGEEPEEGTTTTTQTTQTTPTTTEEVQTTTEQPKICSFVSGFPKSCSEIQFESGSTSSQLENCVVYPNGPDGDSLEVLCDFEADGGGWTIIQKRSSGTKEEFQKNWTEYAKGFDSLVNNFWLGLENIHALTKNGDQELRIELEDFEGEKKYAKYSNFSISDASDFDRLSINGFSGDANDSMTNSDFGSDNILDGIRFSTKDRDNDNYSGNCAVEYRGGGGWWFNYCSYSNLNGLYFEEGETAASQEGIWWHSWKGGSSLAKSGMKIRAQKSKWT